ARHGVAAHRPSAGCGTALVPGEPCRRPVVGFSVLARRCPAVARPAGLPEPRYYARPVREEPGASGRGSDAAGPGDNHGWRADRCTRDGAAAWLLYVPRGEWLRCDRS